MLADEINRASPKTQAALLEAMQERQVSIDGTTHQLQLPFLVVATQNPVEYEGTYPLPEAQLDRFLLRVGFGYPEPRGRVGGAVAAHRPPAATRSALRRVVDRDTTAGDAGGRSRPSTSSRSIGYYMVDLVTATRTHASVQVGASPRGSLALVMAGRARAVLAGRDFVTPEDVKAVAVAALGHRIVLKPAQWVRGVTGDNVVTEVLAQVPTPSSEDLAVAR